MLLSMKQEEERLGRVEALQALAAVSKLDEEDIVDVLLGISDIYLFLNSKNGTKNNSIMTP